MPANAFRNLMDMPSIKGWQTDLPVHKIYMLISLLWGARNNVSLLGKQAADLSQTDVDDAKLILDRLVFVYTVDRFSALIDDTIRFRLENKPTEAAAFLKKSIQSNEDLTDLKGIIEKASQSLRKGSLEVVVKSVHRATGVVILTDSELSFCRYWLETRNMLVHRGELIDQRLIDRTHSRILTVDMALNIPDVSEIRMKLKNIARRIEHRLDPSTRTGLVKSETHASRVVNV